MKDSDFEEVIRRVEKDKSEQTANQYVPKIRRFRKWLNDGEPGRPPKSFEEADAIDIEDWLAELDDEYNNASSVGKADAALIAAFDGLNKLIEADRIDAQGWNRETPADRADYSPDDKGTYKSREHHQDLHWLKPEEVDRLANHTERLRDELIVRLLFQTGIRVSELCDIRRSSIDWDARSIHIRGKGRKNRTVYYQSSLDLLMNVWDKDRRPAVYYADDSDYLFPTSHSEQITPQTVQEIVREAAKRADLQDTYGPTSDGATRYTVTPHVLRHSFAMAALDRGWDVYTLSRALGHADTETTTSTYLHDDEEKVRRAFVERGVFSDD